MYSINEHLVVVDKDNRLEPWTSYDRVIWLVMNFIKHCPVDEKVDLPWYLLYSCFWTDPLRPTIWPDNPAGKFAWAVTTLLKYYPYSGDASYIEIVRTMLDRLIEYRVPSHLDWGNAPYASAHPGTGVYFGARADGEYATESDKVAQVGCAFIDFYKVTTDEKYLRAGKDCGQVLISHLRPGDASHSPLPFRVHVKTGEVIEEYTADMIQVVRLFDELIKLGNSEFQSARDQVFEWIQLYPLQNNIWKGYFEDIRLDPDNGNRDQLSALETARYLIMHPESDPGWKTKVPQLIDWVLTNFGAPSIFDATPIYEQKYCRFPMGSHTARFASLCAMWYEISRDEKYRNIAMRSLNWASYMACDDGTVTVGVDLPDYYNQCWFTDGYFDYVPHFIDSMAAMPELAPSDTDHILSSNTVIQNVTYDPYQISYKTFDQTGIQKLKLTFEPIQITCGGENLICCQENSNGYGWTYDPAIKVLCVHHPKSSIVISGQKMQV